MLLVKSAFRGDSRGHLTLPVVMSVVLSQGIANKKTLTSLERTECGNPAAMVRFWTCGTRSHKEFMLMSMCQNVKSLLSQVDSRPSSVLSVVVDVYSDAVVRHMHGVLAAFVPRMRRERVTHET